VLGTDLVWFSWPVTFSAAAAIAALRVADPRRSAIPLAVLVVAAFGLSVVLFTAGLPVRCTDDFVGLDLNFLAAGGLFAFVASLGALSRLYQHLGQTREQADKTILLLFLGVVAGAAVELWPSALSLAEACDGQNAGRLAQLAAAAAIPLIVGAWKIVAPSRR